MEGIVHLLNEIGMLATTPRSGFAFLGTGNQSVAEHSYRTATIGFVLADLAGKKVNRERLLYICLFHDLLEARTGDLNYVNKRYVEKDDRKALNEVRETSSIGRLIAEYVEEYEKGETLEAQLAHDADKIELLLVLKQELDTGNPRAADWFDSVEKRISTEIGKKLAAQIKTTPFDAWWLLNHES
jgi:putative hydrolase of HD superfamily